MIKKTYNEAVVATIRNSLPVNEKIVPFLSDLFFWSKEAIYRRLRCEIAFTFEEIVVMAKKLDFSLDSIIKLNQTESVVFDLSLQKSTDPIDIYCEKREQLIFLSQEISNSVGRKSLFAINYIPFSFSLYLDMLSKLDYYRWLHQTQNIAANARLCDVIVPERIKNMRSAFIQHNRTNSSADFILDNNVFLSVIRDINYFYRRKLINTEELHELRQNLIDLVDSLIKLCETGIAYSGEKIQLYLSPIDIASNHFYIEYNDAVCCYVQVYGIDILQSDYPEATQTQKEWIERHKKYATLITQSGELERFQYFEKQRHHILNMGEDSSFPDSLL